jgi:hypothetical protein
MGDEYGELRHGYTVAQLDALARIATKRERWYRALDFDERVSIAFSAIALALYSAEDAPSGNDLIRAGMRELSRIAYIELGEHGVDVTKGGEAPNFVKYWTPVISYTPDHAPGIVERIALQQIWSAVSKRSPGYSEALAALAAFDSYSVASVALGIKRPTFAKRIAEGRAQFLELWHQGEQPSKPWGVDRRRTAASMTAMRARSNRRARKKKTPLG